MLPTRTKIIALLIFCASGRNRLQVSLREPSAPPRCRFATYSGLRFLTGAVPRLDILFRSAHKICSIGLRFLPRKRCGASYSRKILTSFVFVRVEGIEPSTFPLSEECSATELHSQIMENITTLQAYF